MQGKQAVNVFSEGMSADIDILNQQASSYRDSMNGRLLFNKDGTYSWETENGTKTSFILKPNNGLDSRNYKITGNTGNNNICIIFSITEDGPINNSEIGIFSIDEAGIGSYKTLFNDINDPNGDLLNFFTKNQIEARFVYENPKIIRVYWVDGVATDSNRPRTITFSFDENLATPVGNQSDVAAYSGQNLSVFSMNSQTDFKMGLIKYVGNIGGGLLSGSYQYTYSLGTNQGYWTPWYPPTRRVLVIPDQVNATNWNEYEMGSSGITTSKGNRIEIKGIDTRYDKIRVAYTLAYTSTSIVSSKIFLQTKITGENMLIDNVGNVGEPLLTSEIGDIFSGILGAKTLNIKDATLYYGNIKENILQSFDIEPILANLTITPRFKDMRSDEWHNNFGVPQHQRPITHGFPRTGITQLTQHSASGGVEDYSIFGDYINYKGTQIDHLYPGYFRGETYRFAIVFYDKLGFESFAFHLGDVKFPEQSTKEYEWNRVDKDGNVIFSGILDLPGSEKAWPTNNYNDPQLASEKVFVGDTGQNFSGDPYPSIAVEQSRTCSHLRIMGVKFSGIDVSSIAPFISGFKIVRAQRDRSILLQGLILPLVTSNDNDDGSVILPLPSTHQDFADFDQPGPPHFNALTPLSSPPSGSVQLNPPKNFYHEGTNPANDRFVSIANGSVVYSPGLNFGTTALPSIQSEDRLTLIGGCWDEYSVALYRATASDMWYSKQYYSKNPWHYGAPNNSPQFSNTPYPRYMSYMEGIARADRLNPTGAIEEWKTGFKLKNEVRINEFGDKKDSHGMFNSLFISHGNFIPPAIDTPAFPLQGFAFAPFYKNIESPRIQNDHGGPLSPSAFMGSFIMNWVRPNSSPYGGLTLTSLEQSIFYGTGHFQPIGNVTFDNQGMPSNLVFDDIDVYGGDCYLDYISMLRLYPHHELGEDNDDYSDGRIWPWEHNFNHPLREALSEGGVSGGSDSLIWANVGTRTGQAREQLGDPQWAKGLFAGDDTNVFEEFNLNGVLSFQELTVFYNTKPIDFLDNDIFPVRWRFTPTKLYGDPIDTWRLLQVNDFRDLNGEHGEITSSLYIFNQIYSWQISAFGRLRASDRALIESQQGGTLSTGIGDKLDGIDYISTEFGNQHQWGLFASDRAAYWIDVNKRKIMRFAQDGQNPLSDIKGMHSYLELELPLFEDFDNPVNNKGIHGTFDYGNNDAIFTFNRNRIIRKEDSKSSNKDINIISRSVLGKTFSPYIVGYNQTAIIGLSNNNQKINLPIGNIGIGINENTLFYMFTNHIFFTVDVYNVTDTSSDLLVTMQPNKYYRFFRHSISDEWIYEEVEANDTTPHKASLTFNEYGNWFVSHHSYAPTHYINTKFVVLSQDAISTQSAFNNIQIHDLGRKGEFISFSKKSYVSISSNEVPMIAKEFDSLRINCNEDYSTYLDIILMSTETQFYFLDMSTDTRKKYLEDVLRVPLRTETQDSRMRGKHLLMTFELKNNFNYNDRITNLVTYYRESNRN